MSNERRMIAVTVRFWAEGVKSKEDKSILEPKKAWAAGYVSLGSSAAHGIQSSKPVFFNSLEDFMNKLHKLLDDNGVTLVMKADDETVIPRLGNGYPLRSGPWYRSKK